MARMGLNVAYIGKVGNDNNGNRILNEFREENVDFLGEISLLPKEKTGYSIILDNRTKSLVRLVITSYLRKKLK